jgi:hypothetical protein
MIFPLSYGLANAPVGVPEHEPRLESGNLFVRATASWTPPAVNSELHPGTLWADPAAAAVQGGR